MVMIYIQLLVCILNITEKRAVLKYKMIVCLISEPKYFLCSGVIRGILFKVVPVPSIYLLIFFGFAGRGKSLSRCLVTLFSSSYLSWHIAVDFKNFLWCYFWNLHYIYWEKYRLCLTKHARFLSAQCFCGDVSSFLVRLSPGEPGVSAAFLTVSWCVSVRVGCLASLFSVSVIM